MINRLSFVKVFNYWWRKMYEIYVILPANSLKTHSGEAKIKVIHCWENLKNTIIVFWWHLHLIKWSRSFHRTLSGAYTHSMPLSNLFTQYAAIFRVFLHTVRGIMSVWGERSAERRWRVSKCASPSSVHVSLCQLMSVCFWPQRAEIPGGNVCNKTFLPPLTSSPVLYGTSVVKVCVCVHACVRVCVCLRHSSQKGPWDPPRQWELLALLR